MDASTVRSPEASAVLPHPGDVIAGKYRIEAVIGTGGMGIVMGALDTSLGRSVAIKFLSPQKSMRAESVGRFLREARAAAAIESEHVVRVFEVSTLPNDAPFIVMEQLRGADLSRMLKQRGALPIDEACDLVLQACEALGEAHARGIVHRDLKPQNLFLTLRPDGSPCVKVLDFGISKASIDGVASDLTATDVVMGTPLYMSPEQVRSLKNVDARADIWALGVILFELLTRAPIYEAPSLSALCAMIATDPPTPLRARRTQAPIELESVILRCLHKDPAGRFQDVAALADALVPFASERGRMSATRISHIVRAGTGPRPFEPGPGGTPYAMLALPAAMATTTGAGSNAGDTRGTFAPSMSIVPNVGPGPSYPSSGALPMRTQSNWQQANSNGAAHQKRVASGALVAMLSVFGGLVVLTVVGGGAWYVFRQKALAEAPTSVDASTGDSSATALGTTSRTAPTTSSSPLLKPEPPSAPKVDNEGNTPRAVPRPSESTPKPPEPTLDQKDAERNAALARANERQCANHRQQMTTFARDEASRKRAATLAKGAMCRGLVSSRCERQVCLEACLVLKDPSCIQSIKYVIDHGPPPKY